MFETVKVRHINVEYSIDETIPGPHPKCAACHKTLLKGDEHITLRRDQVNVQGIREGIFFCFSCSLEVVRTITRLLGYGK